MKIKILSIPVRDQEQALKFYTDKLGFVKKQDVTMDDGNRWLTVVSREEQDGPELLLEPSPNHFEPSKTFQNSLYDAGIPYTQFRVNNVEKEYDRLLELGVDFSVKPTGSGTSKIAMFDDTCGNRILIVEML